MNRIARRSFIAGSTIALCRAAAQADAPPRRTRIKIGQIGVGHAHATKLAVYRRSADYDVIGIVGPDAPH